MKLKLKVSCFMVFVFVFTFLSAGSVQAASSNTVSVGGAPCDLAVTPDGKYVYVPNGDDVAVIDTSTKTVIARIAVGAKPYSVATSPDNKYIYVTNRGIDNDGSVSVISVATNTVASTVAVGGDPTSVVVSPDGAHVYILKTEFVDAGGYFTAVGMVSVLRTSTNSIVTTVPVEGQPCGLAMSPDGNYVYVTTDAGLLSVVATSSNAKVANIVIGNDVGIGNGVAVSPDGAHVYVLGMETVFVISTKSNTVVTTVSGLGAPSGVVVSSDGTYVYVTENWNNTVSAINTVTHLVEFTVKAGVAPYGIVVSPDGQYLYVSNLDYTPADSFGVNYVGTVSIVSTDPNATGLDFSTMQLLIIIVACAVVTVIAFLVVMRIKRKPKAFFLVNFDVKGKTLAKFWLTLPQYSVFV